MNLLLGRVHCARASLPVSRGTPPSSSNAPTEASPANPNFAAEYLIQSCGLSSDESVMASKRIRHLKSPDNPDAVLRFLRDTGVSDEDIRTAVSADARILCSSLEKTWRPNVAKLQEVGFSITDISAIIARRPYLFRYNLAPKIDFWIQALGSAEFLPVVLNGDLSFLSSSLENVLVPNLSFLKDQCGLSTHRIVRLIKANARLMSLKPEVLKINAERAEELGIARSSGAFLYALIAVSCLDDRIIDARKNNLRSFGLLQEEVTSIVSKFPLVLSQTEETIARKIEFLINEFGCETSYLAQNPSLLAYSLDRRLIPRNLVRKLLKSKGISAANQAVTSFVIPTEKQFLVKFVMPYEHAIPGLQQAYADACS